MHIVEEPLACLSEYASVPIAFTVDRILDVLEHEGTFGVDERDHEIPYIKDYDAIEGNHPTEWPSQFNTSNWTLLAAYRDGTRIGRV